MRRPSTTMGDWTRIPGRARETQADQGKMTDGEEGEGGETSRKLVGLGLGPQGGPKGPNRTREDRRMAVGRRWTPTHPTKR